MAMSEEDQINFFFQDPSVPAPEHGTCSILHLLRRDIRDCLHVDLTTGKQLGHQIIWPGIMGILTGIDLLAKFYKGKDDIGGVDGVTGRFKAFVGKYFENMTDDDPELIYQLRNSVLHSFGWYSRTNNGTEYRFLVNGGEPAGPLTAKPIPDADVYVVYWVRLLTEFEAAIHRYRSDLRKESELRTKFTAMFGIYGMMGIWPKSDSSKALPDGCEPHEQTVSVKFCRTACDRAVLTKTGTSMSGDTAMPVSTSEPAIPISPSEPRSRQKHREHH